ncbi:MAG: hypothetical protein NW223_11550 [Hyphomicrobiaceae bacterium]|nr:hypothetical protein [Hyphomicrobiaceae bacterium]
MDIDCLNEAGDPNGTAQARAILRAALQHCADKGVSQDAVLTALLSEALLRLVATYGPQGVAAALHQAGDVIADGVLARLRQ